jgi:hypothetical protein
MSRVPGAFESPSNAHLEFSDYLLVEATNPIPFASHHPFAARLV